MTASPPSFTAKIGFLRGLCTADDEAIETHFAWVFLIGAYAVKLRKPVRRGTMDYGSLEARRLGALAELRLNLPLAPEVYLEVVPLTVLSDGRLAVGGEASPCDWLVRMRRLDRGRFLDALLTRGADVEAALAGVARRLADFYRDAAAAPLDGPGFLARLRHQVAANHRVLDDAGVPGANRLCAQQDGFIASRSTLLADRATSGCVVEAHGDLRPEHIFLGTPPAVIDRLEFDRDLRTLDRAEELSFLELECARIRQAAVGQRLRRDCLAALGDSAPPALLAFYRSHRAATRAKLYVWRSQEPDGDTPETWIDRARSYLGDALAEAAQLSP